MLTGLAFVAVAPASAAAGTQIAFTIQPNSPTIAGETLNSFAVTVQDSGGSPATDSSASDTIRITSSCTLTGTTSVAANSGTATATFSGIAITAGTSPCTLTAADTTNTGFAHATSNNVTLQAGTPTYVVFTTQPLAQETSGTSYPVVVAIQNQYHVTVQGSSASVAITSTSTGCSTVGGGSAIGATNGVASFNISVTVASAESCLLTATDSTDTLTGTSTATSVSSTTPVKLGFTTEPAATAASGVLLPSFSVAVEQGNGVVVTSITGGTDTVSLTSSCALSGTTTAAVTSGVATFTAVSIKTGTACILVATDTNTARGLTPASSTAVTVLAGAATKVAFTTAPPTTVTTAGTVITAFKASVEDVNGNVETTGTGATDTIAITSPCLLGGTASAAAIAGVATFSALTINVTGACVLTATDSTRTLTAATATTTVGLPQAALVLTSVKGTVGKALGLATTGGTGTGALSYTATAGTAGCTVSGNALKAARAGTCDVTATKAASTTYMVVSSVATKVTFVLPFKATRVAGRVIVGRTSTITIIGSGFTGRPRIIANVAGLTTRVTRDTGKALTVVVAVRAGVKTGVHTFTIILGNGKRTSVKFSLS